MAAEDEIEGVQHVVGREDVRGPGVEEVLLDPEPFDSPGGAPDVGLIGDPVGGLPPLGVDFGPVGAEGLADLRPVGRVVA